LKNTDENAIVRYGSKLPHERELVGTWLARYGNVL
jgi:hypothetical protein